MSNKTSCPLKEVARRLIDDSTNSPFSLNEIARYIENRVATDGMARVLRRRSDELTKALEEIEPDPMELAKAQKEDQALFELEDEENDR